MMDLMARVMVISALSFAAIPSQTTLLVPAQYTSIQAAIAAALPNDSILVSPGLYIGAIDFLGKAISVQSVAGPLATIVDANFSGSVVTFASAETPQSRLSGFTIAHGVASLGGGIRCAGSSPTIENCHIAFNNANTGGGISCNSASPLISGCVISDNTAQYGAGIHIGGNGSPSIVGCTIENNTASQTAGATASAGAAGVFCGDTSTPTINACVLNGNTSSANTSNLFSGSDDAICEGGAIVCRQSSSTVINDCLIFNNTATSAASGTNFGSDCFALGAGVFSYPPAAVTLNNCSIWGNSCQATNGPSADAFAEGAGLWNGGMMIATNCLIYQNSVMKTGGGGAARGVGYFGQTGVFSSTNSTFAENAGPLGGGTFFFDFSSACVVANSIIWGNPSGGIIDGSSGILRFDYCDIEGGWTGIGFFNINADPLFAMPSGGDFHLTVGSPCIDTANNAAPNLPAFDFEGNPRILGVAVDMGVDEYQTIPDPLGGSGLDFVLTTTINGVGNPLATQKSANPGDLLNASMLSPGGAFVGDPPILVGDLYITSLPAPAPIPGLPYVHIDPLDFFVLFTGLSPIGGALLPSTGLSFTFQVTPSLVGLTIRLQAAVVTTAAPNGFFITSDAHDIVVL